MLPPFLVQCGDETLPVGDLVGLPGVHGLIVPELLTDVGGQVFTRAIEQAFENPRGRLRLEVGDDGGDCPDEAAG